MTIHFFKSTALLVFACALAGCATPQAVLDQANNGAALSISLQTELDTLRSVQANVAKLRLESIRRQKVMLAEYDAASAFDARVQALTGTTDQAQLVTDLRLLADSRAQDDKNLEAVLAMLDVRLAGVLDPVPAQDAKLAATQKAMAALGEELRPQQRVRIIAAFAGDLKKAIDSNKAKVDAAASAPEAPLQVMQPLVPVTGNSK